ncbi:MAG TPA: class I SAM-dependent methyltransferase [Vicinamibacteria bacterium]|nr:class I SAM-dependent methyltransferase [Vicinamibacteria bacterium]
MALYGRDLAYVHAEGFETWIRAAAPALLRLLERGGVTRGDRVIDLGCGSGLWVEQLQRAGYRPLGIDASPAMVALARRRVPDAAFRTGTIARARLPRCHAVTALGECFNYRNPAAPGLSSLFARVHHALVPGGMFVFDVRVPADGRVPPRLVHRLGRDWAVMVRIEERGRELERHITTFRRVGRAYRRSDETHRLRLYPRDQVARALRAAGFTVSVRARLGSVPLTGHRIVFVARRA